ncbi:hypothetical protein KBI33_03235 [Candidatus Shapirobacteria bacterium]|nr:hypothetical protein [Candidatus Shapirobacteria bacterium]
MNKRNYPFAEVNMWLAGAEETPIFLPSQPKLDQVAAACALSSALTKAGKPSPVISPEPLKVEFSQIYGIDKVGQEIKGKIFVVNIDYSLDYIEKISWDDRERKVSLLIQPKAGAPTITPQMVSFANRGGELKNLIAFGFNSLNDLERVLQKLSPAPLDLNKLEILNINLNEAASFGRLKVVDGNASSYAEIVAALAEGLSLPLGEEEASNLLLGLKVSTDSFSDPQTSPDAFEAAAFCLRRGGRFPSFPQAPSATNFNPPKIYRGSGGGEE